VNVKEVCERQNNKGLRRNYDSNFKLMVIREAEKTNNCAAARKFSIMENNVR
jgi:transposase-like protein